MNLYDTGRITTLSARTERNRGERFRALFTKNCFFREHMNKLCKKSDRMKKGIREEGNQGRRESRGSERDQDPDSSQKGY